MKKYLYFLFVLLTVSCTDDAFMSELSSNLPTKSTEILGEQEAIDFAMSYVGITRGTMSVNPCVESITTESIEGFAAKTRAAKIDTLLYLVKGISTPVLLSAKRSNPTIYAIFDNPDISVQEALNNPNNSNYGFLAMLSNVLSMDSANGDDTDEDDSRSPEDEDLGGGGSGNGPITLVSNIDPKIPVEWSQLAPFNRYCPSNCPVGCVAVATAQAMMVTRHVNIFNGLDLNYESLIRVKNSSYQYSYAAQTDTIAMFMRLIGIAVGMDYSQDGSSAETSDAIDLFTIGGKMNKSTDKNNIETTLANYEDGIIVISSRTKSDFLGIPRGTGHCYLADGFKKYSNGKDLIHVNYGWGPGYNGYYLTGLTSPRFTEDATYRFPHEWKIYCIYNH